MKGEFPGLVPANGFYEWTGRAGHKLPHLIRRPQAALMAFAGLWEHWLGADGSEFDTMAILTVAANATVSAVHDRMLHSALGTASRYDEHGTAKALAQVFGLPTAVSRA